MNSPTAAAVSRTPEGDAWRWWESRRLTYNVTLGLGGCIAYGLTIALNYVSGHRLWLDWRGALGTTLFLGTIYLVLMGAANVCYLLGAAIESWVKPRDVERYRKNAYAMGRWGSLIVPFAIPSLQLALLIGTA